MEYQVKSGGNEVVIQRMEAHHGPKMRPIVLNGHCTLRLLCVDNVQVDRLAAAKCGVAGSSGQIVDR
jgi:hypothetical protein